MGLGLWFVMHGQGALLHGHICLDVEARSDWTLMAEPGLPEVDAGLQ